MRDGEDILVTGGAGFIGSWFCQAVLRADPRARVICLDKLAYCTSPRTVALLRDEFGDRFVLVHADVADSAAFARVASEFPGVSQVAHFAAESFVDKSFDHPGVFVQSNIVGTLNMLEYAKQQRVSRVLHVSTDEVYGEALQCSEDAAMSPTNPYASSKAGAEMFVLAYWKSWNVPVVTVRCSNVYGPRQYPEKIVPLFCRALAAQPPQPCWLHGNGHNKRRYLYATDAAEAMVLLLKKGEPGLAYNVSGGVESELQNRQVLDLLLSEANLSQHRDELVRFGSDRVYNDAQYSMACNRIAELGWAPCVDLRDGFRYCLDWERQNRDWFTE